MTVLLPCPYCPHDIHTGKRCVEMVAEDVAEDRRALYFCKCKGKPGFWRGLWDALGNAIGNAKFEGEG